MLIQKIRYKAELVGISVIVIGENYTSKCSALDSESIEHHDEYLGRRKTRGQFISSNNYLINADVNAAFNILRLGLDMMELSFSPDIKAMLWSPKSISLQSQIKANVNPIV
jgi:putative transposase